jgi:quercetin dioxygenase-like cupin family protein
MTTNNHTTTTEDGTMRKVPSIFAVLYVAIFLSGTCLAQDAAKVDPKHYKVEFENSKVRILRVTYAPGEKSVMHEHPDAVAVFLSDFNGKFTFADGKTQEMAGKAGQTLWTPAAKHLPENIGDKPYELIVVELKSHKK